MSQQFEVALIIDPGSPYDRRIVRGVAEYVHRARREWSLYVEEDLVDRLPDLQVALQPDGQVALQPVLAATVERLPDVATMFVRLPLVAMHDVAEVADHVTSDVPPLLTDSGLAVSWTSGAASARGSIIRSVIA